MMPGSFFNTAIVSFKISISSCISCIFYFKTSNSSCDASNEPSFKPSLEISIEFIKANRPFLMYRRRHVYIEALEYPVSSDINFAFSPSSKQR